MIMCFFQFEIVVSLPKKKSNDERSRYKSRIMGGRFDDRLRVPW